MDNKWFIRLAWATLIVTFLVIIAGSVVRMTGSGMGCPDWPKCFGYYIPPTQEQQVAFQPNHEYHKGQMIIVNDDLMKANENFISGDTYNPKHWHVHEKHDYAIFNARHTWTEYINRLFGALSGLFMLALFLSSIVLAVKKELNWSLVALCFLGLILLGYQAWLGRTVVDSNLDVSKITAHMFGAIALIAVLLLIIRHADVSYNQYLPLSTKYWTLFALIILLIQILLGTQVRQLADILLEKEQISRLFINREFLIHRSFSWVVSAAIIGLNWNAYRKNAWSETIKLSLILVLAEIAFGIILNYWDYPKFALPLHLLLANVLFTNLFWVYLSKIAPQKT